MTKISTLEQISNENDRIWQLCKILFNGRIEENLFTIDIPLWDDNEGKSIRCYPYIDDDTVLAGVKQFLYSPEGIWAIKENMLERNFNYHVEAINWPDEVGREYTAAFFKVGTSSGLKISSLSEIDVIIKAAESVLLGDENE